MSTLKLPKKNIEGLHFIGGQWISSERGSKARPIDIISPYSGSIIGKIWPASKKELNMAVEAATRAQVEWELVPLKERCELLFLVRNSLIKNLPEIANRICIESGKVFSEAEAEVRKGIEVMDYAISLQNILSGGRAEVSRGVFCEMRRKPLGVVAGITPFNFPAMVPMWMIPISIALGNSFLWKPSDKTPLTSLLIADAFSSAGLPSGVFSIVHGGKEIVDEICEHPGIQAIGFVGSTPVAKKIYEKSSKVSKRSLALGGAKNHIILMPDANLDMAVQGIVSSFTGCAGQRCMAASVLLVVGSADKFIKSIVEAAKKIVLAKDMGAIISKESLSRLQVAINRAEKSGAKIILDGRKCKIPENYKNGNWLGPTILDQVKPQAEAACEELFGPVLSIIYCKNLSQAMEVENQSRYGNACSVFTNDGAVAELVAKKARVGMVGINVGVPVPREPFSFGGIGESKFGSGEITGEGSLNLWSDLKKITVKWQIQKDQTWMS